MCEKEIGYREWTEVVVAVRNYIPHRQDVITESRKICDECMREVGLMEKEETEPSKYVLVNKNRFFNILKKML